MPVSDKRVCPDCGEGAGAQAFCAACGKNLSTVERLPSRAEWEAAHNAPAGESPSTDTEVAAPSTPALPNAGAWRDFDAWGDFRSFANNHRVAIGTGFLAAIIAIVLIVIFSASGSSSSSGSSNSGASFDPTDSSAISKVQQWLLGESNIFGGAAECTFDSEVATNHYTYSCTTFLEPSDEPNLYFQQVGVDWDASEGWGTLTSSCTDDIWAGQHGLSTTNLCN
jgi:hypothetical protein